MKRSRVISVSLIGLGILLVWFFASGVRRASEDLAALQGGKEPVHARFHDGYFDGGTQSYLGRGYTVYKMHRILKSTGGHPPGYLGGTKLEWWFPLSLFKSMQEDYHYIPE